MSALDYGDDLTFVGDVIVEATSATLPAHQTGDLIIGWAFRDGSTNNPAVPGGLNWTTLENNSDGTTCSSSCAYKIAASSGETSGTWVSATLLIIAVWRPKLDGKILYIDHAYVSGTGSNMNFQANAVNANDRSRLILFAGHRSTDVDVAAPSGFVRRDATSSPVTNWGAVYDSNGPRTTDFTLTGVAHGGTSSGYMTSTIEVQFGYRTEYTIAGSGTNLDYGGSIDWVYTSRVTADDASGAENGPHDTDGFYGATDYVVGYNFGLSLPFGAVPLGMQAYAGVMDTNDYAGDVYIGAYLSGSVAGEAGAGQTRWAWTNYSYGSPSSLPARPGGGDWTRADINSSNFGIFVRIRVAQYVVSEIFYVDDIYVQVIYAKEKDHTPLLMAFP